MLVYKSVWASVVGLLGEDLIELILRDQSVPIEIGSHDHLVELGVGDILAQFLGDPLEVLETDEA